MNKNFKKIFMVTLMSAIMLLTFAGCKSAVDIDSGDVSEVIQEYPIIINEVTINSQPSKVVVLSDSIADVIVALKYETSLIAASDDCTQSELDALTKIDGSDMDAVIALSPDLVLGTDFTDAQIETLQNAGITVLDIATATSRTDFERLYTQVGSALYGAKTGYTNGLSTAEDIFITMDDIERIIPDSDVVVTAAYLFDTTDQGITGDMLMSDVMSYCGVTNVLNATENGVYSFENLSMTNPQYIFCPVGVKDEIMSDPDFASLYAVINDQVYEIDSTYITRQGRSIITAATTIAGIAYPELLEANVEEEEVVEEEETTTGDLYSVAIMELGDQGSDILEMQDKLYEYGYIEFEYSDLYTEETVAAVSEFQKMNGLTETGSVDASTYLLIYEDGIVLADGSIQGEEVEVEEEEISEDAESSTVEEDEYEDSTGDVTTH